MRELLQVGEPYGMGGIEDGVFVELEVSGEPVTQVVGHLVGDHEPHALAEPAALQLVLYGLQEVGGFVFLDHEVGVAGYLEDVARDDLFSGEQLVQVRGDDLLDPDEAHLGPLAGAAVLVGEAHKAVYRGRHLYAGHHPPAPVPDHDEHVEREVGDVREGVGRVYGERREYGQNVPDEPLPELPPFGGPDLVVGHHAYALVFERRNNLRVQYPAPLLEELLRVVVDAQELFLWRHPVGDRVRELRGHLLLQPRDPDHEELVQVGLGDGDEAHPLQERMPLVAGLLQDPVVEPQPRELPVYV